jgi:hypothetical protein
MNTFKIVFSSFVFILLTLGLSPNINASDYGNCGANQNLGKCAHQSGKSQKSCEDLWESTTTQVGQCYKYQRIHCKWNSLFKTCDHTGAVCTKSTDGC